MAVCFDKALAVVRTVYVSKSKAYFAYYSFFYCFPKRPSSYTVKLIQVICIRTYTTCTGSVTMQMEGEGGGLFCHGRKIFTCFQNTVLYVGPATTNYTVQYNKQSSYEKVATHSP